MVQSICRFGQSDVSYDQVLHMLDKIVFWKSKDRPNRNTELSCVDGLGAYRSFARLWVGCLNVVGGSFSECKNIN
jgi:hypothetical protein